MPKLYKFFGEHGAKSFTTLIPSWGVVNVMRGNLHRAERPPVAGFVFTAIHLKGRKVWINFINYMIKKILIGLGGLLLLLIVIGLLVGGGSEQKSGEQTSQQGKLYQVGEDVMVGDVRWKVTKARDRGNILRASESRFKTIAKDKKTAGKFIEVAVEIENRGSDLRTFTTHKLVDDKGREYVAATDVSEWIPEDKSVFLLTNLNPNIPQQFIVIYEVAVDATGLKLKAGDLKIFGAKEALIYLGL